MAGQKSDFEREYDELMSKISARNKNAAGSESDQQDGSKLGQKKKSNLSKLKGSSPADRWGAQYSRLLEDMSSGALDDDRASPKIDALISGYGNVRSGLAMVDRTTYTKAYKNLLSMQKQISRNRSASGLLAEDAEALRAERDTYRNQLDGQTADEIKRKIQGINVLLLDNASQMGFGAARQQYEQGLHKQYAELEKQYELATKVADIDTQLELYDRIDGFHERRIAPLKNQQGFTSAREDYTFAYGQKEAIDQLAKTAEGDFRRLPDREKLSGEQVGALEKFGWNNLKPEYAFERLGSATMTTLYHNLRKGEDVFYQDVVDARAWALECMKEFDYGKWKDQLIEYESVDGKKFSLSLEERMSLYAYSRRRQAIEHLTKGGIVLNENTKRTVKGFLGIQREKVFHDYNNYRLSLDTGTFSSIKEGNDYAPE